MDKLQQIKLPIDKEFEEFRRLFDSSLQSSNSLLSEVLSYIKRRNGKMMRPILSLLMAKLLGEINDATLHAALSLELLHTASLVHDDVVDTLPSHWDVQLEHVRLLPPWELFRMHWEVTLPPWDTP